MVQRPEPITIVDVERAYRRKAAAWKKKCFQVASAVVDAGLVAGTAVYGHWTGPIHPHSCFASRAHVGFMHHGWVLLDGGDGRVLDPTRWAFEAVAPYIFVGEPEADICATCGHSRDEHGGVCADCFGFEPMPWPYDEGGDRLRARATQPPSAFNASAPNHRLVLDRDTRAFIATLGIRPVRGRLAAAQIFWLANCPYATLGPKVAQVYAAISEAGFRALIPIDNLRRCEREHGPVR